VNAQRKVRTKGGSFAYLSALNVSLVYLEIRKHYCGYDGVLKIVTDAVYMYLQLI